MCLMLGSKNSIIVSEMQTLCTVWCNKLWYFIVLYKPKYRRRHWSMREEHEIEKVVWILQGQEEI
jgi:hypothetical protein